MNITDQPKKRIRTGYVLLMILACSIYALSCEACTVSNTGTQNLIVTTASNTGQNRVIQTLAPNQSITVDSKNCAYGYSYVKCCTGSNCGDHLVKENHTYHCKYQNTAHNKEQQYISHMLLI
ncbi:MAG: hypothetical protein QNK11_08740 [Legionella sp.]|nr:hypothetical protein [Legionella sp.]